MRTFQRCVGIAVVAGLLAAPGMVRAGGPVDPATLSCGDFLDLGHAANQGGTRGITAKMEYTRVGYWVLGYLNGFIAADGGDRVLGFRDRDAGSMVVRICNENSRESLMSAAAAAALLATD
ncbi:MAG: hypothetical protein OXI75_06940 [Rhodospirillales bacterium]|nr:hypothetical protein [Rhodospirillales bacterium]